MTGLKRLRMKALDKMTFVTGVRARPETQKPGEDKPGEGTSGGGNFLSLVEIAFSWHGKRLQREGGEESKAWSENVYEGVRLGLFNEPFLGAGTRACVRLAGERVCFEFTV